MTKNNVRIAIRDSTDSHNVVFFDNRAGIKYKSANLQRFLAGSASILTLKYNSKDIDSIRSGCKLAFRYKARDYWLNIMKFEKQGFEVEITACSLHLELNREERGAHKPDKAMSFAEYLAYYDPEHALTLGTNQVSDKKIKLEWTGTDTILARLFSIANSFDAELEFVTELNDDYSLKRHVLNVYKKGNLGSNKTSSPVRVGKELKVINYSDNIEELSTAVRATGKDGLTIDGLNKKIYDDNKELLYYSSGMTVYAPQSRDRFPSVGQASNDNWIVKDLGETEYETKEGLWGYMYGEIQKICLPKIEYTVTGAIDSDVGDTQTLIDDVHYEPPLYLKARVSELTDDILQGKVIDSTFINFERQYSQIADSLLKQVEALAEDAAPYIVRLSTDNGYNFKNGQGTSTITAKLEKYSKIVNASWKWLINNSIVSETSSVTINASQVVGTLNVVAVAIVDGNEVAREYITFTNSDDGVGIKSIKRYYTTNDQAEGVTVGGQNWSTKPTTVTADNNYMWSYDVITYTNDTSLVTEPAVIGARGDDGLDADTTGITEALDKAKQELTALSANIEKVRDDSLAAVEEAKQQLTAVANDLSAAKQDLQTQASQLTAQASAQSELTKRVSSVEETANGTKTTVSELSKTVAQNGKDITSVSARTKTVEDDLTSTKTTLSQVQTTANSTSQKTATLETGLNGLSAKFENLSVGNKNYLPTSRVINRGCTNFSYSETSKSWTMTVPASSTGFGNGITFNTSGLNILLNGGETLFFGLMIKASKACSFNYDINNYLSGTTSNDNDDRSKQAWSPSNKSIPANVWTRVWFSYTAKANVPIAEANSNFGIVNNTESITVEIKEVMVAKSNVPVDYQTPDADVEQKIAEYKQNADQNYASLQTTVQNLDGTVKQNKSEFDQTASQIKSSISAVEGKIPTSVGARNYIKSYGLTATGWTSNRAGWKFEIISDSTAKSGQYLKATCTTASTSGGGFYKNLFDFSDGRFFGKQMTWAMDIKLSKAKYIKIGPEWGKAYLNINATTEWQRYSNTFTVATTTEYKQWIVYTNDNVWNVGDIVYIRDVQLEDGSIATSPVPAIEDTESDISQLNTTLTQTATGLEQLSTQVTSQGNTITSHTNSINSLATGLSAKVSQTDFNTLSGRVTTTENNITAKANELSSKISSVEGLIPTSSGGRNLAQGTSKDWSTPYTNFKGIANICPNLYKVLVDGLSVGDTLKSCIVLKYTDIVPASGQTATIWLQGSGNVSVWGSGSYDGSSKKTISGSGEVVFEHEFKIKADHLKNSYWNWQFRTDYIASGSLQWKLAKVERGMFFTDWGPAPEDYDSKLASAQSEIKQTTDAISASVSALDSSTVKTATLNLDNNGFVTKVGKTVNGNTFATMIAQNESDVQIIAKKMKVSGDMIVNGAITAEKLNINSLSALSADLGDVTSGSITNSFVDYTRSGTIKIDNSITIDTKDTSATVANKANQHIEMNSSGFALTAENSSNTPTYSMQIIPESINFNKLDYDTTRGGTSGWSLTHNGYYSMLQVDMVWQNVRINNTSNMPYGTKANFVRIGNLVTVSVNRQITNVNVVTENKLAIETIPEGFRPITQAHLTLIGNTGSTIDATCICHLNPDGSIYFTNNKTGNRVWTGTVTYTCVEPMPYVKDLNNGSTI